MAWQLPPLNPLKAFEAAGRNLSFKRAAAELHVTQAAVSRQVRLLEETLGVKLFQRQHRAVALTAEGREFLGEASAAFNQLNSATARLKASKKKEILRLQGYPTVSMHWLVPCLTRFHEAYPNIEVQLSVSHDTPDFEHSDLDGAIRSGNGQWPGLRSIRLFPYVLVPVCSPKLLQGAKLRKPQDLAQFTLLHSIVRPADWRSWLSATHALQHVDADRGMKFQSPSLAYEAAVNGAGIAIAQPLFVKGELASRKLVMPLKLPVELPEAYYFVSPAARQESRSLAAFRSLLQRESQLT
ncbi:MAG TPA: transcriptional regulator GcvA [Dongiaceae bacterium]|jgi:LysR family glycine cleavage system transcriptional activator|nr:transcriptional regulator GcvA [Dongiaceae bacterium]